MRGRPGQADRSGRDARRRGGGRRGRPGTLRARNAERGFRKMWRAYKRPRGVVPVGCARKRGVPRGMTPQTDVTCVVFFRKDCIKSERYDLFTVRIHRQCSLFTLHRSLGYNSIGGYYDDEGDFLADLSGVEELAEARSRSILLCRRSSTLPCTRIHCQSPPLSTHYPHTSVSSR